MMQAESSVITEKEYKKILLGILDEFDRFCQENNLTYFLAYGTLLGAVRHKGFIPWDDDIDVMMPRKDYEIFLQNYKNIGKYKLVNPSNTPGYYLTFSKLIDSSTTLTEKLYKAIPIGAYIDIFPLDYIGDTPKSVNRNYLRSHYYLKALEVYQSQPGTLNNLKNNIANHVLHIITKRERLIKKIDNLAKSYSLHPTKHVGNMVLQAYGKKEILLSDYFSTAIRLDFCGRKYYAPEKYEEILKIYYGNYWELPPLEKRTGRHNFTARRVE